MRFTAEYAEGALSTQRVQKDIFEPVKGYDSTEETKGKGGKGGGVLPAMPAREI
jgi:hypothetical protein